MFLAFLTACAIFGGASRLDEIQTLVVLLTSIVFGATALLARVSGGSGVSQAAKYFIIACATLLSVQLLPIPFGWWSHLPGHQKYAEAMAVVGVAPVWRPINLTPSLGAAALLSLLPVASTIIGFSQLPKQHHRHVLAMFCIIGLLSALFGLMQVVQGDESRLRLYAITSADSAVGLFANRNHHALLMVMAIPMIASAMRMYSAQKQAMIVFTAGLVAIIFLVASVMIAGSRAGLVLVGPALIGAILLGKFPPEIWAAKNLQSRLIAAILLGFASLGILGTIVMSRTVTLDRFVSNSVSDDMRSKALPTIARMAYDFFPVGSGFGSFSSVYRSYEPDSLLSIVYLNQAHNDWLQLVIEGGLPAVILLAAFGLWWVRRSWMAWTNNSSSIDVLLAKLGSLVIALIGTSSLVDYPLRTPLVAVIFSVAALWLQTSGPSEKSRR